MSTLPPVVLIHGMWSTPDAWIEMRAAFEAQGYRVYTPRLPFHYPIHEMDDTAQKNLRSSGVDDYVESVCKLVSSLKVPPILVGHSLGGVLAQLVAAKHPCEKLVLISSAAPAGINAWSWSVTRTFGHNLFKFPAWRSIIDLNIRNIRYGIANSQSPQVQEYLAQETTLESGRVSWQVAMWFLYRRPATSVNYKNITCPVLILGGTEDKITPIEVQRKIATKYSNLATVVEVQGACHWTIGGSFYPVIQAKIDDWLNANSVIKKEAVK